MPVSINGSGALTYNDGSVQSTAGYVPFRNRIINGGMTISQRNGTSSVNVPGTSYPYQMDRFYCGGLNGVATPFTLQQVTDAPAGFANSVRVTVANTDALSNVATEYGFQTNFEANNTADFGLGTASASTVTLSFWVKSSLTGTFGIGFRNVPTFNRTYVATYTVNAANTWEYKTITLPLDTTGTWNANGTSASINITWSLGCGANFRSTAGTWQSGFAVQTSGSANLVSNAGATWQITGVQLEKGSVATPFEVRPYGTELALCQRYYEIGYCDGPAANISGAGVIVCGWVNFAVRKPGTPTMSAPSNWTSQASAGGTTSRTFGIASSSANGFNAQLAGGDPRAWGNWIASNEL